MESAGHSFDHSLQAGQIALIIAEDEYVGKLAGAAGLCHSADRILEKLGKVDGAKVIAMVRGWIESSAEGFLKEEINRIIGAILLHSGPNILDCDPVLIALQDADRIVCSMADAVMGAAQFRRNLPTIDPRRLISDPSSCSFQRPRSILMDLYYRNDWVDPITKFCVRLPKARVLMERRVGFINQYVQEIAAQRGEIGLSPEEYPSFG